MLSTWHRRRKLAQSAHELQRTCGEQFGPCTFGAPSTLLWSCACNADLYIHDIGTGISKAGWLDGYLAMFLWNVGCQPGAVAAGAMWAAKHRYPRSVADVMDIAMTIAERSIAALVESGATTDLGAMRRLRASMELRSSELVFGAILPIPQLIENARQRWAEELS